MEAEAMEEKEEGRREKDITKHTVEAEILDRTQARLATSKRRSRETRESGKKS
jgi:hypothetical protein